MYHIRVRNDEDKKDTVIDTNSYVLIAHTELEEEGEGLYANSVIRDASAEDVLHLLLGMDEIRNRIIKNHPIVGLMYELKDELVERTITKDLLRGTTETYERD